MTCRSPAVPAAATRCSAEIPAALRQGLLPDGVVPGSLPPENPPFLDCAQNTAQATAPGSTSARQKIEFGFEANLTDTHTGHSACNFLQETGLDLKKDLLAAGMPAHGCVPVRIENGATVGVDTMERQPLRTSAVPAIGSWIR